MGNLRDCYEDLEHKVSNRYDKLLELREGEFSFYVEQEPSEVEDFDDCPTVYLLNIRGEEYEVKVMAINSLGVHIVQYDDNTQKECVRFSDISSLYGKIELLECMEEMMEYFID
jgi:hypothetical protein